MASEEIQNAMQRRRRAKILRLIGAAEPYAVPDAHDLYRLMQDAGETLTIDALITLLRDLRGRGYVKFEMRWPSKRDELPAMRLIRLEPKGRDILEQTISDAAVDIS